MFIAKGMEVAEKTMRSEELGSTIQSKEEERNLLGSVFSELQKE